MKKTLNCLWLLPVMCGLAGCHREHRTVITPTGNSVSYIKPGDSLQWRQGYGTPPSKASVWVVFDGYSPCDAAYYEVPSTGTAECKVTAPYGYYSYHVQTSAPSPAPNPHSSAPPGAGHGPEGIPDGGPPKSCKPACPPVVVTSSGLAGSGLVKPATPIITPNTSPTLQVLCSTQGVASVAPAEIETPNIISWVPAGPYNGAVITFTDNGGHPCGKDVTQIKQYDACTLSTDKYVYTYTVHEDTCLGPDGKNHDTNDNTLTVNP